jgi:hypothetical protein
MTFKHIDKQDQCPNLIYLGEHTANGETWELAYCEGHADGIQGATVMIHDCNVPTEGGSYHSMSPKVAEQLADMGSPFYLEAKQRYTKLKSWGLV